MTGILLAADASSHALFFGQQCLNGLTFGALITLVALGYTMVYGIIGLINFAHGDLCMLGAMLTMTLLRVPPFSAADQSAAIAGLAIVGCLLIVSSFCAVLNLAIDRIVYKPLRHAPRLAPLVSAIGVSFIFMNIGMFWGGPADISLPQLVSRRNLLGESQLQFTVEDLILVLIVAPLMIGLTVLVKYTRLGKAMRASAQDPVAAQLMGIPVERVIAATFLIGGALGGAASVIYGLYIRTIGFQMGFQMGLYAFTAAVLGGIGNIPGAVLGGFVIGLIRSLGSAYVGERWSNALIFGVLIVILVFRPQGLLGVRVREKV